MRTFSCFSLATALLVSLAVTPAIADDWRWHGDIHHFHEYDYDHWREGNWYHGFHDGRGGWWWITGGIWYYYPAPVYPYPDPYIPPGVVIAPSPASPVAPSAVYYCPNPSGYYPYVPRCYVHWERVESNVLVAPQPAPAPVIAPALSQRDMDSRQLNDFAAEFHSIDPAAPKAHSRLRALEKRVEAFRQALYGRAYNAMDILHDAERLKQQIADERAHTPK